MSLGDIRVELELDDQKFTVRSKRAGQTIREMGRDFDRTSKSVNNIEKSVTGFLPKLRDIAITASILKGGLMNLYGATLGWQKSIIDTNAQVERMTFLLQGMSTAASESDRIAQAADDVRYLFDQAERAPFSLGEMTNTLVKMKSVGLDGAREAMQALTDSVAQFGGTDETLHRATIAIQQMAGKGVISMEELRQQLGEAVPTAIGLMARSMNMTYQELVDNIATGRVEANDALQRMFREMERTMGGAGERMMDTWGGMVSRLQTRWMKFQLAIGEQGMYQAAKEGLQLMIDQLDQSKIEQFAVTWGQLLANVITGVTQATQFLIDHGAQIIEITKNLAIMFAVWKGLQVAVAIYTAVSKAALAFNTLLIAQGVIAGKTQRDIMGVALATKAVERQAITGAVAMRAFWAAATGPIGLVVAGILAVGSAFIDTSSDADKATEVLENNTVALDENTQAALRNAIAQKKGQADDALKKIEKAQAMLDGGLKNNSRAAERFQARWKTAMHEASVEYEKLSDDILKLENSLNVGIQKQTEYFSDARVEALDREFAKRTASVNAAYSAEMTELADQYEKGKVSQEQFEQEKTEIIKRSYDGQLDLIQTMMANIVEASSVDGLKPLELAGYEAQLDSLNERFIKLKEIRAEEIINSTRAANLLAKQGGNNTNSKLDNVLANAKAKVAELTAELEGGEGVAERFMAQLQNGVYGKDGNALLGNKERLEEFIGVLEEQARIEEKLVETKRIRREADQAQQQIQDRLASSTAEAAAAMNFLLTGQDTSFVDSLNAEFAELLGKIPNATDKIKEFAAEAKQNEINAKGAGIAKGWLDETQDIRTSLMRDQDRYMSEYLQKLEAAQEEISVIENMSYEERKLAEKAFQDYKVALLEEYQRNSETPMQKMLRDWGDMTSRMQSATANWLDDSTDRMVEFAKTGKFEFGDMVESILADILKLQLQSNIAGAFGGGGDGGLLGFLGGMFGGGSSSAPAGGGSIHTTSGAAGSGGGFMSSIGSFFTSLFADGGIMTSGGSMPLKKYANGGIANSPQLALFGEGRMNEAYVPLPDGRTIPVTIEGGMQGGGANVQVNVINQTSQEVQANQGNMKFDGKKMILDVVLTAVNTPGPFRDSMRGAVR